MGKFLCVLVCVLGLTACQGANVNDLIGGAYAVQKTISESVYAECRNETPGGPCVFGSAISTQDKNRVRAGLDLADSYTDDAARLAQVGKDSEALTVLQRVDQILDELEAILIQRGIE